MKTRFDLEEEITSLYHYSDDLRKISENSDKLSSLDMANSLVGISNLIDIQAGILYETMCEVFKLNKSSYQSKPKSTPRKRTSKRSTKNIQDR